MQSGAEQAGQQAYQQASNAFPQNTPVKVSHNAMPPALQAAPEPAKPVQGRMLTFVSAGGKGTLSSNAQTDSKATSGR